MKVTKYAGMLSIAQYIRLVRRLRGRRFLKAELLTQVCRYLMYL